jgi:hypothetical protein
MDYPRVHARVFSFGPWANQVAPGAGDRCIYQEPLSSLEPWWASTVAPDMLGIVVSKAIKTVTSTGIDRTLDAHDLGAEYLRRPAETIFKDLTRAPHRLPPSIQIPGRRGRVWLESEVVRWLKGHQESPRQRADAQVAGTSRWQDARAQKDNGRRVGRPTKRQQLEKARLLVARGGK